VPARRVHANPTAWQPPRIEVPIAAEHGHALLPRRYHAYTPPRASNFSAENPTCASAACTPTSRMGAL